MRSRLLPICALAALAGQSAAVQESSGGGVWIDLELPAGFHLDLASGEVTSRPPSLPSGVLSYANGRLESTPRLAVWERVGAERTSTRVARGGGTTAKEPAPVPGTELLFDVGPDVWGYLRVLAADEDALTLEYARAGRVGEGRALLEREPAQVLVEHVGGQLTLTWPASEAGAEYEIRRAVIGPGGQAAEVVARGVRGGEWTDPDSPSGVVVEYRVARTDGGRAFGARARGAHVVQPGDWPMALDSGMFLNVITGEIGGESSHLEVIYAKPPYLNVRPLGGTKIAAIGVRRGDAWLLPEAGGGRYDDRRHAIKAGADVALHLPEGIYVRLRATVAEDGRVMVRRQFDLSGDRRLPATPELPEIRWTGSSVVFEFPGLGGSVAEREAVSLVVERELGYQVGDWEELTIGRPGTRTCEVEVPGVGHVIARYRFRHRFPWGSLSFATEPLRVLHGDVGDPAEVERLLDRAFEGLLAPDFDERLAARGVLTALGDAAWPRLREALTSEEAELAAAAADLLLSSSEGMAGNVEVVLRARAEIEGVTGDPPAGWCDAEPDRRALALLGSWGQSRDALEEERLRAWTRVLVLADPDPIVGSLARLQLEQASDGVQRRGVGVPYALLPADRRPVAPAVDWRALFERRPDPFEVAGVVRASLDLGDPRAALVQLEVAYALERLSPREAANLGEYEMALRLVEQYRERGADVLLEAAEEYLPSPGARLRALAELADRRLSTGVLDTEDLGRRRIVFEGDSLDALGILLDDLFRSEVQDVDVVLPAGTYAVDGDATQAWIDVRVPGLRLLALTGEVELLGGVRLTNVRDVVLEGLRIRNPAGTALYMLSGSSAVVEDCVLVGRDTTVQLQESRLELDRAELTPPMSPAAPLRSARSNTWSVRMTGRSLLFARDSLITSGSIQPSDESLVYIERSVVRSGARNVLQGQRRGALVVRDSLLASDAGGVYGMETALFEGVVIDVKTYPLGQGSARILVCPEHVILPDASAEFDRPGYLEACPLDD